AEDGIRDDLVTGVQTCALPISSPPSLTRSQPDQDQQTYAELLGRVQHSYPRNRSPEPASGQTEVSAHRGHEGATGGWSAESRLQIGRASCRESEEVHATGGLR